jgi:magnesium-protoporphyrin O-methyltransferase
MRDLPTTRDFGDFYNARKATSELRRYRNKGPNPSTRMLIDALKTEGVEGATVLDIGGGIGAVQHELLAAGRRTCDERRRPRSVLLGDNRTLAGRGLPPPAGHSG